MKYICLILILSSSLHAQVPHVNTGDLIEESKINALVAKINSLTSDIQLLQKQIMPVGTVISSVLTLAQYRTQNGDCWNLMDGSSLASTNELKSIYGFNQLPQAMTYGTFIRQNINGRQIGSYQSDEIKSHNHSFENHPSIIFRITSSATGFSPSTNWGGSNHQPTIGYSGSDETLAKNIAVNMFIKFKKQCNFN